MASSTSCSSGYGPSDPGMEEALYEIPVMRRFDRLGSLDSFPDETTILNFRRLLGTHDFAPQIQERVKTTPPPSRRATAVAR